ncbi:MAG TPA: lytic transglycosylase domain-containing protein, partial [Myxococcales bacterium]|nr:lytic transglycosylase domain-containing protein [Myxococcales bacterium]
MRSAIAIVLAAVFVASAARAQEDPWGDNARQPEAARENEQKPEDLSEDDPDAQAEVEKSAAELEAVRKAEEKAGLVPQAPGAGPRDGISVGLDPTDPIARDLSTALGSGLDGAPLADPAPAGSVAARIPELLGISDEELRAKYDIPVELNDAVVAYIRFFQTDAREHFSKWLSRSTRYIPMMRKVLEREGVPLDTVYLAMIESGFSAYAYSFAKAAGPWQFVVGTSRRYGLLTDFWVDERRDPYKSTIAASKYLKELKARFRGDWYLAWAGYNAGEGKISRAIRKEKTTDFWRMMGRGRTLRAETKHYVPKLIAAALIAKHPERFGFHVDYDQPRDFEEVRVPDATDLHVAAKAAGITFEELR